MSRSLLVLLALIAPATVSAQTSESPRSDVPGDASADAPADIPAPPPSHVDATAPTKLAPRGAEPIDGATAYHHNGFAFGIEVELAASGAQDPTGLTPGTHAFIGYQGTDTIFGLTLGFEHDLASGAVAPTSSTLLIGPSLGAMLVHSQTRRTEMLGIVSAAYRIYDSASSGSLDHQIAVRVGPCFRFWIAPSFAVAVTANLRFDQLAGSAGDTTTVIALGSALDLAWVF